MKTENLTVCGSQSDLTDQRIFEICAKFNTTTDKLTAYVSSDCEYDLDILKFKFMGMIIILLPKEILLNGSVWAVTDNKNFTVYGLGA